MTHGMKPTYINNDGEVYDIGGFKEFVSHIRAEKLIKFKKSCIKFNTQCTNRNIFRCDERCPKVKKAIINISNGLISKE